MPGPPAGDRLVVAAKAARTAGGRLSGAALAGLIISVAAAGVFAALAAGGYCLAQTMKEEAAVKPAAPLPSLKEEAAALAKELSPPAVTATPKYQPTNKQPTVKQQPAVARSTPTHPPPLPVVPAADPPASPAHSSVSADRPFSDAVEAVESDFYTPANSVGPGSVGDLSEVDAAAFEHLGSPAASTGGRKPGRP